MGKSFKLNFSVLLVISVLWKTALSDDKCTIGCKGSASSPSFLSGHKYNYGVEGTVSIYLTAAEKQETSVKILGQVTVSASGNCINELKVQNLVISGPDGKKYSSPPGIDKPVRFTLQDGRVGSEICAETGDTRRSLNIKRAIISLLQTEQKSSTQVDIFGSCPTEASSSQEGGAVLVHRTRDLSRCAHREQGRNDYVSAVYNPNAEIKSTEVLQSYLNVESKVNNGVPEKVAATEDYLYKPFSVGESGAKAKVHTKLTLTGKSAGGNGGSQANNVRTIIFENPHGVPTTQSNLQSVLGAVKDTARTVSSEASSKSAGEFAQLVRILRVTSKDNLIAAYNQVKGNGLEKRVFLDGLLRTGTGYSIEASIDILKTKELSQLEQQLVFLSLGNARHVNNEALKAAASLLDLPNAPNQVFLGVGALAGTYCKRHNCHTTKSDGIVALSTKLVSKLHNCRPKNKVEEDSVVAVLKGIRNIHHLEDTLVDKLAHCAVDANVKPRVKSAALEAFQADPCAAKLKKTGLDILKNRQLDSEIRIKAYLAIIACPCGKSANEIKTLLDTEPVHQVGRFITTSLRNIRTSVNPDKQLARQHYGLIRTPNKFNVDDRKYSFYEEASYNVDALGIGGNLEETVIYSQDSFLPRSVAYNLTTEVFGHNINVLEIGGRQGNLDRVIEHFLGPKSFLRTKDPQSIYDDIKKRYEESKKKVESGLGRRRRSVKTDVANFDKHLKAESVPYNNELDLDIYVKLFGTDAVFLSLGDDKGVDFGKLLDQALKTLNSGFHKLKRFNEEVRAHVLFLDAELAYPTSTGLPLKLDLIGSATGRFEVSSNVDIPQIIRDPQNAKIDVKLVPSTDVEVACLLRVDADAVATGLKISSNLHSSTGGHLIFKVLESGRGFDLQFGLPIDKQEIITVSDDMSFITSEKGQKAKATPLKLDVEKKEYSECFDQLVGVLGVTVCGEVSVPFSVSGPNAQQSLAKFVSRYPWTGPAKLKLVLEKNDLRGYHIKGLVRDDRGRQSFELLFDAEGSKNRRTQLTGEFVNIESEKSIKLALDSPIKVLYGQVAYVTKPEETSLLAKGKIDNAEYYGKIGISNHVAGSKTIMKPIIEYQDPQGKHNIKVDGQLVKEKVGDHDKYTLEGVKIKLPPGDETIDLSGHYTHPTEIDVTAKKGDQTITLQGSVKGPNVKLVFQNTLNPYINFKINGHFANNQETTHNDIELIYGGDLRNSQNKIVFNQLLKVHKKSAEDFNVITKNKFEIQALPFKVAFDAEVDPKKVDVELEGQYQDKKAEFDLEARTHIKKAGDYSVKISAEVDNKGVEAFAKRDIVSQDKSNFENYISIKNFGKYELSGVVLHKNKPNDINLGAIGHFKISAGGKNEDIKFDLGVLENANLYSSHAKVSSSKGDWVDYLLKITRGPNTSGQLKVVLKDTISANGQFKVTDNDGKGNGAVIVDFKKAQRKIKADVKFVVKDPVYNADVDVFLNFEKDNNDRVHFSTHSKKTDKLVDTKNKLVYGGKTTELNIHQDGEFNFGAAGKTRGNIEIILPTERCLTFKLERDVTEKDGLFNGHAQGVLSDAAKRGGPASSFTYKGRVQNTNFEKDTIHYDGEIDLKLKDGKNLQSTFSVVNVIKDGVNKFDFKSDVKGNLLGQTAVLTTTYDFPSEDILEGKQKYRLFASYGGDISFELDGKSDISGYNGKGDVKYLDEETITIHLPIENARDIKQSSYVLFVQPEKTDSFEYTIIESVQVNDKLYKGEASGKLDEKAGNTKIKIIAPQIDPLSFDVNYKADLQSEKQYGNVDLKAQYGKGKSATISVESTSDHHECVYKLKANAPQAEKLKKLEVDVIYKHASPDSRSTTVIVDADGRVYKSESTIVYSKANPLVDLKYTSPSQPQPSRIFIKGTSLSSNQGKIETKIENVRKFNLDATSEGNIQKDNVVFKLTGNSEALGLKNAKFDVSSKDSDNGKRLEFHAVNDNKNVISGSTSFISKQEGPKTIIEGSGSVKVQEEQKSANFKYIRTLLTEGNEQGVETFLNWAIGDRSYVAESRVTNLEYKTSYVYCEEKKQCANIEVHSKTTVPNPGAVQNVLNVVFDLRKLGISPEFGLQVKNEVSERKLPQYNLDLHVNNKDKKYHLHVYSQPEYGKYPAGITITLPQRTLALESSVTYPTNKGLPFPIKVDLVAHPDKNKPQLKTAARFNFDVTNDGHHAGAVAEFAFFHPKIVKEAVFKVRANLDRPNDNTIKIQSTATFSHPPAGSDLESKIYLEMQPVYIKFLVQTPSMAVVDVEGSAVLKDNLQQGDLKFSVLQGKPVQFRGVIKDYKYYEFTTGYTDESERKLSVVGHIDPEKRVDITADIILPGEKKNIIFGALYLQDNLVKTDYGVSKENFNYFIKALHNDLDTLETRVKQFADKTGADINALVERCGPGLRKVEEAYKEDLTNLYNELSVKDISRFFYDIEQFVTKIIQEIATVTEPLVKNFNEGQQAAYAKLKQLYETKIEPGLKEFYKTVGLIMKEAFDGLIDLVAHVAAIVTDFFEKHKAELQELTDTIAEIFKDLTRLLVAQLKELRERAAILWGEVSQQIKELPIVGLIKEKWQELVVPEQLVEKLQQFHLAIRDILPTDETKNFADALYTYVAKKLRQEKTDDVKELRIVYEKFAVAVTSLFQFVRNQLNQYGVPNLVNVNSWPSLLSGPTDSAPFWASGSPPSSSWLNELISGDVPDILAYIRAYRPRSLNPLDEVPAKLRAVVVNGQHIFTFDGRHLTFPGNCRYVLVHDHVDRNFTLVLQLQNGQPKALALEDQSGDVVEIKENGQATLNGAVQGFPIIQKDAHAFKHPKGLVGLGSTYGLLTLCTSKFEVCYIEVSGFYLGKLRGLLGDGNNEPYDDFRLPNGKISASESEFGNSYRLSSSCAQVKTPEHSSHQHHATLPSACEKVFGASSVLKPLSLLLDVTPFRQACIHAVTDDSANALHQACDLARGYTALAVTGLLPAVVPDVCVKCTDADKPRSLGEEYELKLPNKLADIIVAVETTKANEKTYKDLVVPLVSQLVDQLKSRHITDIKVYLVGITSKFPYPIVFDTERDPKLKNAKVKFTDESRYERFPIIKTDNDKEQKYFNDLAGLVDGLRTYLGLTNVVEGYRSLLDLPLRAGAVKHSINVVGERCLRQSPVLEFLRIVSYSVLYSQNAMSTSLITVTPGLEVGGGKPVEQVVGFSEHGVILLGDKKKNKDAESLRESLKYEDDGCVNFIEEVGGYVFSATNFQGLNAGQQKQFLQTAAGAITHRLLHENLVQDCTCSYVDAFTVRSICVNKERKETARRRK